VQSALTGWHMASMALHNTWQNNLHVTIVALVVIKIFFLTERFKTLMTNVGNLTSVRLLVKNELSRTHEVLRTDVTSQVNLEEISVHRFS